MDFADTPEEAAFRAEVRAFLEAHAPPRTGRGDAVRARFEADEERHHLEQCRAWQRVLHEHGWAAITWPVEFGGRGGSPMQRTIFNQEQARFDVTNGFIGATISMFGPALMRFGSAAQHATLLPGLLRGEEIWCQLFSEPGAGSDLANLRTRAERTGAGWRVTGQKVWTSSAHVADRAILLARTDPEQPKHRGITAFVLDMGAPGIEIRPLRQISGVAHFNEVFLEGVELPVEAVLGEVDGGWAVARTVLASESSTIGGLSGLPTFQELRSLAALTGTGAEPVVRQRLAHLYVLGRLREFLGYRVQTALSRGEAGGGVDGSVLKLLATSISMEAGRAALAMQGPAAGLLGDDAVDRGYWQQQFMNQFALRIGGGTTEVHRTMIGERVLGLPPEPRVDRGVAFRALAAEGR